jgi:hypothetical protein
MTISPFGGGPTGEETVAEKVTDCPTITGFGDDVTTVVVGAFSITCFSTVEVLPVKLPSPP